MDLIDYIEIFHLGNQAAFGAAQGVDRRQVGQWVKKGFIVVDGKLYSPRRELNT